MVVIIPLIMNTLQYIIQDAFLKKSDFEITDIEIMKKYYSTGGGEEEILNKSDLGVEMRPQDETQDGPQEASVKEVGEVEK